jgi:prohibitin 2
MVKKTVLLAFIAAIFLSGCGRPINSGQAGIFWSFFSGTDTKKVYGEGFQIYAPWNRMYIYDIKITEMKEKLNVLSFNGLSIDIEVSVRFKPMREELPLLHVETGVNYYEVLIGPSLRSEARKIVGRYKPEEIYSTRREAIEGEILTEIKKMMNGKHMIIDAFLIRDVILPKTVKDAIEHKLTEEQNAQRMEFTILKEIKEAERKRIEAKGISDFQNIVAKGISDNLLRWKGIEATEKLALSQNTKIIIVGSGKSGLPVILDTK